MLTMMWGDNVNRLANVTSDLVKVQHCPLTTPKNVDYPN